MPDLRDRLAILLHEAHRTSDAWMDARNWRRVADALLASEEWQAREAVVEAAGDYVDLWRQCHEREDDLGPAPAEDLIRLGYLRGALFAALARLDTGKEGGDERPYRSRDADRGV